MVGHFAWSAALMHSTGMNLLQVRILLDTDARRALVTHQPVASGAGKCLMLISMHTTSTVLAISTRSDGRRRWGTVQRNDGATFKAVDDTFAPGVADKNKYTLTMDDGTVSSSVGTPSSLRTHRGTLTCTARAARTLRRRISHGSETLYRRTPAAARISRSPQCLLGNQPRFGPLIAVLISDTCGRMHRLCLEARGSWLITEPSLIPGMLPLSGDGTGARACTSLVRACHRAARPSDRTLVTDVSAITAVVSIAHQVSAKTLVLREGTGSLSTIQLPLSAENAPPADILPTLVPLLRPV